MARRPRELWSASYMFSYLMEQVLKAITGYGELLLPAVLNEEKDRKPVGVGLYPDRAFLKCNSDFQIMKVILEKAVSSFSEKTGLSEETVKSYFNIYATYVEESIDTDAIKKLNRQLDFLELNNLLFRIRNLRKSCHWLRKNRILNSFNQVWEKKICRFLCLRKLRHIHYVLNIKIAGKLYVNYLLSGMR